MRINWPRAVQSLLFAMLHNRNPNNGVFLACETAEVFFSHAMISVIMFFAGLCSVKKEND